MPRWMCRGCGGIYGQQGDIGEAKELFEEACCETFNHDPRMVAAQEFNAVSEPSPTAVPDVETFEAGDHVLIHGLSSQVGQLLNGQRGLIVKRICDTCRYGVQVVGYEQPKSIHGRNLVKLDLEEVAVQGALEEGARAASVLQDAGAVNAQISDALLQSSAAHEGPQVLCLKFSRASAEMSQLLLDSDELAPCQAALADQGLPVELPSGAKIFVRPDHHGPALAAAQLHGWALRKSEVIVDLELEEVVLNLVRRLPGRLSIYPKGKDVLPLGLAEAAAASDLDLSVTRTFLQIRVPSSLRSETDIGAPRTVSTTDADPRKRGSGPSVRRGGVGPKRF